MRKEKEVLGQSKLKMINYFKLQNKELNCCSKLMNNDLEVEKVGRF